MKGRKQNHATKEFSKQASMLKVHCNVTAVFDQTIRLAKKLILKKYFEYLNLNTVA